MEEELKFNLSKLKEEKKEFEGIKGKYDQRLKQYHYRRVTLKEYCYQLGVLSAQLEFILRSGTEEDFNDLYRNFKECANKLGLAIEIPERLKNETFVKNSLIYYQKAVEEEIKKLINPFLVCFECGRAMKNGLVLGSYASRSPKHAEESRSTIDNLANFGEIRDDLQLACVKATV